MKKLVKKIGRAIAISFSKDEQKIYGIKKGCILDVEINKIKENKKNE